ncbi:hypothetical protein [Streptomyces sp.]|uniref:hypothetical protein n=1 Tax=Streptomyces sp. TaxID=1931 RepID=UPI002F94E0CE
MSTTDQILGSPLDHFTPDPLPLTPTYVKYMQDRASHYDEDIAKLDSHEAWLLKELTACRAVRARLADTRERYLHDLGPQNAAVSEQPVWPVAAGERGQTAEKCPRCGDPMFITKHGFVHEIDGDQGLLWVGAADWCQQPATSGTGES